MTKPLSEYTKDELYQEINRRSVEEQKEWLNGAEQRRKEEEERYRVEQEARDSMEEHFQKALKALQAVDKIVDDTGVTPQCDQLEEMIEMMDLWGVLPHEENWNNSGCSF